MKFFLLLLLLPVSALAKPFDLRCFTDPLTTSFSLKEKGDQMEVQVMHSYGSEYAPGLTGTFTPHDIPLLTERAELVRKLKPIMTFHWPLKKCSFPEGRVECFGSEDEQEGEGGVKFQPWALYTSKISEDGLAGKLEYTRITLSLYTGRKETVLKMDFSNCLSDR